MTENHSEHETPPRAPGQAPKQTDGSKVSDSQEAPARTLSPAAERALAEAQARRVERERTNAQRPVEVGGRGGPDPARYGDWEKGGIAWDF
jgi:hypothetical protein